MTDHILTINAGSSSLKFALFTAGGLACRAIGQIEGLGIDPRFTVKDGAGEGIATSPLIGDRFVKTHADALRIIIHFVGEQFPQAVMAAVGHRVVHGGLHYTTPIIVGDDDLAALSNLNALAPLHQPHNLAGIKAAQGIFPGAPQIACFDTAFHRAHPFVADAFALPRALYDEGVRRYGFHGLSYEYVTGKLREIAPQQAKGRVILCHLGSGASICALRDGRSLASTMGFSPLDGLPMGTRSGQLDPGVLLYLMDQKGMDARTISDLLYRQSGLKGLSGISSDLRVLEASENPHARQAIDYFVYRARHEIGGLTMALGGLDAIVFCGGIGENSRAVRAQILKAMQWIGVELDDDRNKANQQVISSNRSKVKVFVIPTNEELMIARHTARLAGLM